MSSNPMRAAPVSFLLIASMALGCQAWVEDPGGPSGAPDTGVAPAPPPVPPDGWSIEASGTTADLYSVWGTGPTDVWAVGDGGTLLHSTGDGAWTAVDAGMTDRLVRVRDNYIVGASGVVLRRGSAGWTPDWNLMSGRGLAAAADNHVVGPGGGVFVDCHGAGCDWVEEPAPEVDFFGAACGEGALAGVFVVGAGGTILFDPEWGGQLQPMSSGTSATLLDVATGGSFACAVGIGGAIVAGDTTGLPAQPSGTAADLRGVWVDNSDVYAVGAVYAVGDAGTILQAQPGGPWAPVASTLTAPLRGVWSAPGSDVYVVGDGGLILHRP